MIWVVTDHRETREALVPLIAAMKYAVADMDCGDEVLRRIRFRVALLIILDCGLPDSFDLIAKIRAVHTWRSIPILMFSFDSQNLKQQALLRGADAYVPKGSLDWSELMEEVRRLAGPAPAPDQS